MRKRRALKRLLLGGLLVMGLLLLAGMGLHPYLAVTAPVDSDVVAVEGWLPEHLIPSAVSEIQQRGYTRVYTTGTTRPFTYYLKVGERIEVLMDAPLTGELKVSAGGLPGAGLLILTSNDTLLAQALGGRSQRYQVHLPPTDRLVLISTNDGSPSPEMDNLFVKYLTINGENLHALQRVCEIVHVDSSRTEGTASYAHHCARALIAAGIPAEHITIAPAAERTDSRTLANAAGFARQARIDAITAVNVLSLGVHARRSRKMYRKACGSDVEVGVIALYDPHAAADSWYKHGMGWARVLKELGGVPASSLFEAQENNGN